MKTYLRYALKDTFGVINSTQSNALFDSTGNLAVTGALQDVAVWNLRQGSLVRVLRPEGEASARGEVSRLALAPDGATVAAGYSTGAVRIYVISSGATSVTFSGHRTAVTAGRYNASGELLATGSADTDIVIWDTVADSGLYRLRGHRDGVTDVAFLSAAARGLARGLASCSKDTLVKIWDLDTQHCVQTIVGHRSEIWSLDINPAGTRLATGASDGQLRVWALDGGGIEEEAAADYDAKVSIESGGASDAAAKAHGAAGVSAAAASAAAAANASSSSDETVAIYMGSVARQSNNRAQTVRFHRCGHVLGVQATGKMIEIFAVAGEPEAKRRRKRRLKRQREKLQKQQQRKAAEAAAAAAAGVGAAQSEAAAEDQGAWGADALDGNGDAAGGAAGDRTGTGFAASDEFEALTVLRSDFGIRAFDFHPEMTRENGGSTKVLLALSNNALELWGLRGMETTALSGKKRRRRASSVDEEADGDAAAAANGGGSGKKRRRASSADAAEGDAAIVPAAAELLATLDLHGHRSDVRAVAISSDDQLIASVSHGLAKIWNTKTRRCVRSSPVGFGLCLEFLPGDRHVAVGTKEGGLQVLELSSGDLLHDYDAHAGAVWSLDVRPDGHSLATGSSDGTVKFWDFEVATGGALALVHTRTLKATGEVMCVRYSRHRKAEQLLIAVALLDGTVKMFHDDSLRFFLSLYGHKLSVMSMDCSDDGSILATGSADKTVKLWGLDFGDCHRSILAHGDSVMGVRFLPGTHYLLTASKDRSVKYWDADRFELILELQGHQSIIWSLAVASDGSFAVTGGHDRSLRMWERTDEMVFLEEERERRLEDLFEAELDTDSRGPPLTDGGLNSSEPGALGQAAAFEAAAAGADGESGAASRRNVDSIKAGERLLESLELAAAEDAASAAAAAEGAASHRFSPLLLGMPPLKYFLKALQSVRAPELEQALLVLPLAQVEPLAGFLAQLLENGLEVELCAKSAIFLLRTHYASLVANGAMAGTIDRLRKQLRRRLEGARDAVGTNIAALKMLARRLEARATAHVFEADDMMKQVPAA